MFDFLYNLTFSPLILVLESLIRFLFELTSSYGIAIILLSVILNIMLFPLMRKAVQKENSIISIQDKISPKIKSIKKAFKGEEQISMLKTLYRQNSYNPFSSLMGNASFLIQIPFFIALYILLTDNSNIKEQSFLFITDLSLPDNLFFGVNVLPILMLLINLLATWIQSKDRKNITYTTYVLPLIFFVLVYNMPAILLLYWTMNNIFFLFPNKNKEPFKDISLFLYQFVILFLFLVITNYTWLPFVYFEKFNNFYFFILYLALLSFFITIISKLIISILVERKYLSSIKTNNKLFYLLIWTLFFYLYFVFSSFFITSPDIIMFGEYFIQELFIKALVYLVASFTICYIFYITFDEIKQKVSLVLFSSVFFIFIINAFFINQEYGLLDTFIFPYSEKLKLSLLENILHIIVTLIILSLAIFILKRYQQYLSQLLVILNIVGIITIFINLASVTQLIEQQKVELEKNTSQKIFHYSKTGKNIVIIMLDRAFGGFVPDIFKDEPKFKEDFEGFTWYPNTFSTNNNTLGGLQTIYGGENYIIDSISDYRKDLPLKDKRDYAYRLYIDNFSTKNYELMYFAPTLAGSNFSGDCSIFNNDKLQCFNTFRTPISQENIKSKRIISKIYKQIMMLSLFKSSPANLKNDLYQNGFWLGNSAFQVIATNLYKTHKDNLGMMKKLSDTNTKEKNTFKMITNLLTHSPSFTDEMCNSTSIIDENLVKRFDNAKTAKHYSSMKCSMKILNDYFKWFKENNLYDNTMFIITSDHAYPLFNPMLKRSFGKVDYNFSYYQSLLMIKPFKERSNIKTDFTNRMNYEIPSIVCDEINGCYDKFFNTHIKKSKIGKKVKVFDTPWLLEGQKKNSYNIIREFDLEFKFNEKNTPKL